MGNEEEAPRAKESFSEQDVEDLLGMANALRDAGKPASTKPSELRVAHTQHLQDVASGTEAQRQMVERILAHPDIVHQINCVGFNGYETSKPESKVRTEGLIAADLYGVQAEKGSPAEDLGIFSTAKRWIAQPILDELKKDGSYVPGKAAVVELQREKPGHFRHFGLVAWCQSNLQNRNDFGYFLSVPTAEAKIADELATHPSTMLAVLKGKYGLDRLTPEARRQKPSRLDSTFAYKLPDTLEVANPQGAIRLPASVA